LSRDGRREFSRTLSNLELFRAEIEDLAAIGVGRRPPIFYEFYRTVPQQQ
jgi:hypothetical protein